MKTIDILNKYKSISPSKWQTEAEYRRKNSRWLLYSAKISLLVKQRMSETKVTQVILAERMGCTQQHISMLLRGKSNLTLETISKFEEALGFSIIGNILDTDNNYIVSSNQYQCKLVSEPDDNVYGKKTE